MQYPFVALKHFSRQDDYGHLSIIDPSNVVEDENICKAVYHDYNDPVIEIKDVGKKSVNILYVWKRIESYKKTYKQK